MYVNFESLIHLTRATIIRQRLIYYYPIRGPELVIILNMNPVTWVEPSQSTFLSRSGLSYHLVISYGYSSMHGLYTLLITMTVNEIALQLANMV